MGNAVSQILAVLRFGVYTHVSRPRHLLLMIAGFAVASVTVSFMLAIPAGLKQLVGATGRSDMAIVLQADARSEIGSTLTPEIVGIVRNLPGIARDASGNAEVAPQYLASMQWRARDGTPITAQLRGVTDATWALLGLSDASMPPDDFNPNTQQLLAGRDAVRNTLSVRPGAHVKVRDQLWRVADVFSPGGMWNSELWGGAAVLQAAFNAPSAVSVLWVKLSGPHGLGQLSAAIEKDKRLYGVRIESQRAYYAGKVRAISRYASIAALAVAVFLGLGAVIACGNAVSLSLGGRQKELATLRALGFDNWHVATALFLEVLLIGVCTALVVVANVKWLASGMHFATSTGDFSFGFQIDINPQVFAWVLSYVAALGVLSASLPVVQALQTPLVRALGRN